MNTADYKKISQWRQALAQRAELSGKEAETAKFIADSLCPYECIALTKQQAGHGLWAHIRGAHTGPRVLLRADMDALPTSPHPAHRCGHDGHMALLLGLAHYLSRSRPLRRGELVLLFQPAEETGAGAQSVLRDSEFQKLDFDWAFAVHNLPGFRSESVICRPGPFASASEGLRIDLSGRSAHAAEPQKGNSPALALASLLCEFSSLCQNHTSLESVAQCTVIHARLGQEAYGTSPQHARICATLRSHRGDTMEILKHAAGLRAQALADCHGLKIDAEWLEAFPAVENDQEAFGLVEAAAQQAGQTLLQPEHPFPWSEDFGHFTANIPGALVGLGAGLNHPALHNPEYEFPDALLPLGMKFWVSLLEILDLL